ncbi:MAG: hypothetical protein QM820_56655 [Minicystis sp.]
MSSSSSGAGGESSSSSTGTTTSSTSTASGTGGMGGTGGGTGGSGLSMSASFDAAIALDATPDANGTKVFFTAAGGPNGVGVYSAAADGSGTVGEVKAGAPFAAPFGIATSTDGAQLYIADPGATDPTSKKDLGVIFSLPVGGGTPSVIAGSNATEARNLEVAKEGNADTIYFTGRDKTDGQVGVFKIPAAGGAVTAVAKGAPFVDPSGIAVAADGTVYVADTRGAGTGLANIIKVSGGTASVLLADVRVGYPAGVALSQNDKTLYVSALDPAKLTDQILAIDIAAKTATSIVTGIDTFSEAAGLHRAKKASVFSLADITAGPNRGKIIVFK